MQTIEGLFAPLVTPFTDDASTVSEIRFARLLRHLMAQPVDGFIVASDCGEFATLSQSERKQLVEWVARDTAGKPFIVHVSTLSTSTSLDLAQHAARHGARAAVLMPPFYGSYTSDELIGFFRTVAAHAGIPLILVDPLDTLNSEVLSGLEDIGSITVAQPLLQTSISCYKGMTMSDEFGCGAAVASPLALLRPQQVAAALHGEQVDLAKLIILEETLGRARVSKAGLEALGFELGPLRPPLKALTGSVSSALKTLLQ